MRNNVKGKGGKKEGQRERARERKREEGVLDQRDVDACGGGGEEVVLS